MRSGYSNQILGVFALLVLSTGWARTSTLSWTEDLLIATPALNQPTWLHPLPRDPNKAFAEACFEITPPAQSSDLLLTLTFNEQPGGFLKVFLRRANGSLMLCENLYEGTEMPNQRSLLISRLSLNEKGVLTLQASQENLHVYKVRFEWMEPRMIAAAGDAFALAAIDANGKNLSDNEVTGEPFLPSSDQWKGSFITAALIDNPERIEQAIEFLPDLASTPRLARLEGWVSGLPLDRNLTVWINGRSLDLSPEVPDLTDIGYQTSASGILAYVGWRKIQLWIPTARLHAGVNRIQFSWDGESESTFPVSVKKLSLQACFDPGTQNSSPTALSPEAFTTP